MINHVIGCENDYQSFPILQLHRIIITMFSRLGRITSANLSRRSGNFLSRLFLGKPKNENVENFDSILDSSQPDASSDSPLPFSQNRRNDTFGKVIHSENTSIVKDKYRGIENVDEDNLSSKHLEENEPYHTSLSNFRNPDGTLIRGTTAREARLDPLTLDAQVDHSMVELPRILARTIGNNILSRVPPAKLRERAMDIFVNLDKELIQKAPVTSLDADAHIAALFLQNYSHAIRVLKELIKREGPKFNPGSVLDIGYGPGTGMIALNELMGEDFNPAVKDIYVIGRANKEMKKRAKILLSRQLCEVPDVEPLKNASQKTLAEQEESVNNDPYVGPVDTSRINIKSKIRDSLASTKKYDLIMVNQALLTRAHNFPRDVDVNLEMILGLLAPGGHLVLIERGNTLGFEIIARARQVMLRPESHQGEKGRIPRPYIRGSSIKPQKLRQEDQLITDKHIEYEEQLLAQLEAEERAELLELEGLERSKRMEELGLESVDGSKELEEMANSVELEEAAEFGEDELAEIDEEAHKLHEESMNMKDGEISEFEADIIRKHGQVSEEDLKFEFEDDPDFEVSPVEDFAASSVSATNATSDSASETPAVDYHLSVVAPCPHHGECPLQLGDPQLYKLPKHKHRFQFCSFDQVVQRPQYTMELKKGKLLATNWDKSSHDGFGFSRLSKYHLRNLQGSGRPDGANSESGNLSYLIMRREKNDTETIGKIQSLREHHYENDTSSDLPRVIEFPTRIKNNVKIKVCSPTGNVEVWQVPKSLGKQTYHDARKVQQGDLWALGKKSAVVKNKFSGEKLELLKQYAIVHKNSVRKEKQKKKLKKFFSALEDAFEDPTEMFDEIATDLEKSKRYRTQGKRAKFDVDIKDYDGK